MYWGAMSGRMGWGVMEEEGWRKGPWTSEEDRLLIEYVRVHGEGRWNSVARLAGLKRNGKSCRLRWVNYLRPDLKRGQITPHEESIILELHARWGNRWSTIARSLPGRTDNEIKNYWRTHFKKKQAKAAADAPEKAKARLLKRQQFHHQQQLQQQQQQHQQQQHHLQQQQQQYQQQLQLNQMDLKRIMALLEENEHKYSTQSAPQVGAEMAAAAYPQAVDEHNFLYSMLNVNGNVSAVPEAPINEDTLWDYGLWNMEDFHGGNNISSAYSTAKATSRQNLVMPFC